MTRHSHELHRRRPTQRVYRAYQGAKRATNPPWMPVLVPAAMSGKPIWDSYVCSRSPSLEFICDAAHLSSEGAASTVVVPIGDEDVSWICKPILRSGIGTAPGEAPGARPRAVEPALGHQGIAEARPCRGAAGVDGARKPGSQTGLIATGRAPVDPNQGSGRAVLSACRRLVGLASVMAGRH